MLLFSYSNLLMFILQFISELFTQSTIKQRLVGYLFFDYTFIHCHQNLGLKTLKTIKISA